MRILGLKPEEVAGTFGKVSRARDAWTPNATCARRSTLSDTAPTPLASFLNCVARTTASRCGSSGGRGRPLAVITRARCSLISRTAF